MAIKCNIKTQNGININNAEIRIISIKIRKEPARTQQVPTKPEYKYDSKKDENEKVIQPEEKIKVKVKPSGFETKVIEPACFVMTYYYEIRSCGSKVDLKLSFPTHVKLSSLTENEWELGYKDLKSCKMLSDIKDI